MSKEHDEHPRRELFSWMNPKLEVSSTSRYGGGHVRTQSGGQFQMKTGNGKAVLAKQHLFKDEVLFVMGGYVLTIAEEDALPPGIDDKPIELSKDFSVGPRKISDLPLMPQHYVNHSCNPNAGFDGQILLVAIRDVDPDEEITYDYAMVMIPSEESSSYFSFECLCGEDCCRGNITQDDWKRKDIQMRYLGYFSHGVGKLIANAKKKSG